MWTTAAMTIKGSTRAAVLALSLISKKEWFEFTPLPFDDYEFKVKIEKGVMLNRLMFNVWELYPAKPGESDTQYPGSIPSKPWRDGGEG